MLTPIQVGEQVPYQSRTSTYVLYPVVGAKTSPSTIPRVLIEYMGFVHCNQTIHCMCPGAVWFLGDVCTASNILGCARMLK